MKVSFQIPSEQQNTVSLAPLGKDQDSKWIQVWKDQQLVGIQANVSAKEEYNKINKDLWQQALLDHLSNCKILSMTVK